MRFASVKFLTLFKACIAFEQIKYRLLDDQRNKIAQNEDK